jgi:hypothetical protein
VQKENVVVSVYVLVSSLAFSPEFPSSLSFVSSAVFSWSPSSLSSQRAKRRQQQAQARARARRRPFRHKENIGQREAVSALTTPQQRLHEREILIHKLSSAINKLLHNSVCLHEREILIYKSSSGADFLAGK